MKVNKKKFDLIIKLRAINQLIQITYQEAYEISDDGNLVDMLDNLAYNSQELTDYTYKHDTYSEKE